MAEIDTSHVTLVSEYKQQIANALIENNVIEKGYIAFDMNDNIKELTKEYLKKRFDVHIDKLNNVVVPSVQNRNNNVTNIVKVEYSFTFASVVILAVLAMIAFTMLCSSYSFIGCYAFGGALLVFFFVRKMLQHLIDAENEKNPMTVSEKMFIDYESSLNYYLRDLKNIINCSNASCTNPEIGVEKYINDVTNDFRYTLTYYHNNYIEETTNEQSIYC